jgi:hypothetical protein
MKNTLRKRNNKIRIKQSKLGNAGLIRDQRYRTNPDVGMLMPNKLFPSIPAFTYDFSTSNSKFSTTE